MFNGEAVIRVFYTVAAEDEEQAKDFIGDYVADDFSGVEFDSMHIINIKEVK